MKKILKALLLLNIFLLSSCQHKSDNNTVVLGVIAGPEAQLAEVAQSIAHKQYNLTIVIKTFTDYSEPNRALDEGVIDANMFQHQAYLTSATNNFGYRFAVISKTFIYPMGLYSKKINKLQEIHDDAVVIIPNDPSNEARALLLLEGSGLIKLKDRNNVNSTKKDIVYNPKKLDIEEVDAAMIPRLLPDASLAAINTNYALGAGLLPSKDALFIESKDSPYVNLIVVQDKNKLEEKYKKLAQAMNSPEVLKKSEELFHGEAIKVW